KRIVALDQCADGGGGEGQDTSEDGGGERREQPADPAAFRAFEIELARLQLVLVLRLQLLQGKAALLKGWCVSVTGHGRLVVSLRAGHKRLIEYAHRVDQGPAREVGPMRAAHR